MELKTTELRIGNIITIDGGIYEVVNISKSSFGIELVEESTGMRTNGGRRNPIEITKEWLIKLGFYEILKDAFRFETFDIEFLHFHNERSCFFITSMCLWDVEIHVQYVHQLQNIFFILTGKELTHQKIN